jgi:hypothetical protein
MKPARWGFALILAVAAVVAGASWIAPEPAPGVHDVATAAAIVMPTVSPSPTQQLVPWHGPVEHLFFHPLVIDPAKAFRDDALGRGFRDYFVTAGEFRRIMDSLWVKGFTLVDAHRALSGTVLVPAGRKPLVLSEDDVNYYRYFRGRGLAARLVVDESGQILAETGGRDPQTTDQDVVSLVDEFVQAHPDFSVGGAKGVLGLTGYEGLLGYHHLDRPAERRQVIALASALKADGWLLASHTYGHIDLTTDSLATIAYDTQRWKRLAEPLIGKTDLLIYPFGARPSAAGAELLRKAGFPIQFDIDVRPRRYHLGTATVMSRLHIDGFAFQAPDRMRPLFSVGTVIDPERPWPLGSL